MYQCGLYSFQVAGKKRGARKPQRRYEREQRTFYKQAIREKRDLVETLRKKSFDKLDQMERVDVINAKAAFVDAHTLLLGGSEGEREITGDKVFINTGSVPKLPDMAGMKDNPYVYTSKTLMEEEELPKRLAIVGGGFIGLEYASMYQSYGSEVTLLVSSDRLLADEDEDIAEAIAERLQEMGVKILLGARATEIREDVLGVFAGRGRKETGEHPGAVCDRPRSEYRRTRTGEGRRRADEERARENGRASAHDDGRDLGYGRCLQSAAVYLYFAG